MPVAHAGIVGKATVGRLPVATVKFIEFALGNDSSPEAAENV